jgi:hypothetical protein
MQKVIDEKECLFNTGLRHIELWCALNDITLPAIECCTGAPDFGTCAYYRSNTIHIWINSCATYGRAGRQWSWPGYVVDRTPYGVLAHELGHHVDKQYGLRGGFRSHVWRALDAKALTGYCPNDNEWFAELFRLFVTDPDLFRNLRPKIADLFFTDWPWPAELRPWQAVLADSPRHINAAQNKLLAAWHKCAS